MNKFKLKIKLKNKNKISLFSCFIFIFDLLTSFVSLLFCLFNPDISLNKETLSSSYFVSY